MGVYQVWETLRLARERGASDVHLASGEPPAIRIDGRLVRLDGRGIAEADLAEATTGLFDARGLQVLAGRGDADAALRDDRLGSFRIHAYRAFGGLRLAIRLLSREVPTLERLMMPAVIGTIAERRNGLVLFVGPAGSGKTTSLAALIERINRTSSRHVIMIEDPVEYFHQPVRSLVSHREVGSDVADFGTAVRSCLRADPDVIGIGELRDPPTIAAALSAAETGHLVLSTLHTGDAAQTVDRVVDAFSSSNQNEIRIALAQTLVAVVSQRLVPRLGGRGRRAAVEVLVATEAVRALIRDGKTHQLRNAIQTGRTAGMQTLETHLSDLVVRREIALDAARSVTDRGAEVRSIVGAT